MRKGWQTWLLVCLASILVIEADAANVVAPVTQASLDQDKPPGFFKTLYVPDTDGSNGTKIVVAYPSAELGTNAQGARVWDFTNVPLEMPSTNSGHLQITAAIPSGINFNLPGFRTRGVAKLVSVEKLKPAVPSRRAPLTNPPAISFEAPSNSIVSKPMIQIKGASDKPLRSIRYDVINSAGQLRNQAGYIVDSYFDTLRWETTTNYFECIDIELAPGTNLVVVVCADFNRHLVTNRLTYVLRYDQDHVPPVMQIEWPQSGQMISGNSFRVRGRIDDYAARITGQVFGGGTTNLVKGAGDRNGGLWVENVPLAGKTNWLTLTATDAAGNSTTTNVMVIRSATVLTIDPVPTDQLWQLQVKVTGKVSPPQQRVWLNGREATVQADGVWAVTGVPMTEEGFAVFEATAVLRTSRQIPSFAGTASSATIVPQESVSLRAKLGTNVIVLNAGLPTYGTFTLNLTDTAGKTFILMASTNLVDWAPILTNRNSGPTFDYRDARMMDYGCRFFRVVPAE